MLTGIKGICEGANLVREGQFRGQGRVIDQKGPVKDRIKHTITNMVVVCIGKARKVGTGELG